MRPASLFLFALAGSAVASSVVANKRSSGSCKSGTQSLNGRTCKTVCGVDHPGGDYAQQHVNSFQDCVNACAADSRCVGAQFHKGNGYCYLKNSLTNPQRFSLVDTVICVNSPSVSTSTAAARTTSVTTTVTTLSTSTTTTSGAASSSSVGNSGCNAPGASSTTTVTGGPTLLPAVHWEFPVDDIRNLAPLNSSDLYYSQNGVSDPAVEHLYASLSTTFQYESVVLDHSIYVASVSCNANGILVNFNNQTAYQFARQTWSTVQDFVLVTYTDGCGTSSDQRTFWLIDALQFIDGTNSILAKVQNEIAIEDALYGVDLVWGTYSPPGTNSTGTGSTSSSSIAVSGPGSSTTSKPSSSSSSGQGIASNQPSSSRPGSSNSSPGSQGTTSAQTTTSTPGSPYTSPGNQGTTSGRSSTLTSGSPYSSPNSQAAGSVQTSTLSTGLAQGSPGTAAGSGSNGGVISSTTLGSSTATSAGSSPAMSASSSTGSSSGSSVASSTSPNASSSSSGAPVVDNGSACGAAPAATIDGFPAADCGAADFDKTLDDAIGYLDFSSGDFDSSIDDFMPDVSLDGEDLDDDDADVQKRSLTKRGFWSSVKSFASKAVTVVAKVATAPLQIAAVAVKQIPVVNNFVSKATEFDPSLTSTKDIALGPDNKDQSPWGMAAMIYSKDSTSGKTQADVALYCVNCGLKGHVTVAGTAKWNLVDGLHALNLGVNANLEAGLNIGLVASATFSDTKSKSLINQAIPELGVSVNGIFAAGVFVTVDAVSTINISAEGQALMGITMTIPNFQANLNLLDSSSADSSKITGYTPEFKKTFEASGSITASATLSLPVALNVGLQIKPISFQKTLSLIEQPSVYGQITFAGSTANAAPASSTCNNGFAYLVNAQNDVKFDFFGLKTIPLNHYESPPLLQGCKLIEAPSSSTTSSTTVLSTTTTTSDSITSSSTDQPSSTTTNAEPTDGTSDTPTTSITDGPEPTQSTGESGSESTTTDPNGTEQTTTPTDSPTATEQTSDPTSSAEDPSNTDGSSMPPKRSIFRRQSDNSTDTPSGETVIDNDGEDTFASDPNDTSDESNDPVDNDSSSPDNAEYDDDSSNAQNAANESADSTANFDYTTIVEMHNAFNLAAGENGNLYAAELSDGSDNGGLLFASADGVVLADDGERILHYYPDVMAAYKVSRIRLAYEDEIPKTSDVIALALIDYDTGSSSNPNIYFAVTSAGNAYSLVLCDFSNGADSKIFIVDGEDGMNKLTDTNLIYTVTGGPVSQCNLIALVPGTSKN